MLPLLRLLFSRKLLTVCIKGVVKVGAVLGRTKIFRNMHKSILPILSAFNTYTSFSDHSKRIVKNLSTRVSIPDNLKEIPNKLKLPDKLHNLHLPQNFKLRPMGTKSGNDFSFDIQPCPLFKLDSGPPNKSLVTKEQALKLYKDMVTIRRIEITAATLYKEKAIRGFLHLYNGEEAIAVGIQSVMRPQDVIITAYRCHGWVYIMGAAPYQVLSELTGRIDGNVRGKGGSMHMYGKNFFGGNGIVGAQVPLGTGLAFRQKYINNNGVSFTLYGDGASNQGQVYESYNMAKLWKLPCVYVCENNLYGMGTSVERSSANTQYYTRGDYIPGLKADGMDVLAVREASKYCIDYALKNGPIIMEVLTYRYHGHSMSDPGTSYRKREEIQQVRDTRDPITTFRKKLLNANVATEAELKAIDDKARTYVEDAAEKSKAAKHPDEAELAYDIYINNLAGKVRNNTPFNPLEHKNLRAK